MDEEFGYFHKTNLGESVFYATFEGKEVSHLVVNFFENDFPYVQSMNTLEFFRNQGLMENLLVRANEYYKKFAGVNIRSSLYPAPEVKGYYSHLEKKGLVRMGEGGRWEFI